MKAKLLHISPAHLVVSGIRKCWKSDHLSDTIYALDIIGEKDKALVKRIIDMGHDSTLEHSLITFDIDKVSRALLQEISRHRIGVSPSVESTRYTLSRILKGEEPEEFLVSSGNLRIDELNRNHMKELAKIITEDEIKNDVGKYGIVEAYEVSEQISFNFRSFRHFSHLRKSERAHFEIRQLAYCLSDLIPKKYDFIFNP